MNTITKICSIYDTDFVNNLSKNEYELLYKILKSTNINKVKFKGLFTILYNKIIKPPIPITYNSYYGADRLYYLFSKKYNKYVYLIGERHTRDYKSCDKNTLNLSNLIISNLKNSTKFIDVFIEIPIKTKTFEFEVSYNPSTAILDTLHKKLSKCLKLNKSECEYYASRIHYVDPRDMFYASLTSDLQAFAKLFIDFSNIQHSYYYRKDKKQLISDFKSIKARISSLKHLFKNTKRIKINTLEMFNNFNKLNKNLNNIDDKFIKNHLTTLLTDFIDNVNFSNLTYNKFIKLLSYLNEKNIKKLLRLSTRTFRTLTHFMDIYTISRLFRTYRQVKYHNSNSAKYSIIITGQQHSLNNLKILLDIGFELKYERIITDSDMCLHDIPSVLF
jgi:hypothetical protein